MQEALEDMSDKLSDMANELEGIDKSDLSATNRHYIEQAIKLMHSGSGYLEEAAQYLNPDE